MKARTPQEELNRDLRRAARRLLKECRSKGIDPPKDLESAVEKLRQWGLDEDALDRLICPRLMETIIAIRAGHKLQPIGKEVLRQLRREANERSGVVYDPPEG